MTRRLFNDGQLELMYRGALRVLRELGMKVENRQCLEALERFGAKVDFPREKAVFSEEIIGRMLAMVRADHAGWKERRPSLGREVHIGGGGTCPLYFDDRTGSARRANEKDCIEAFKIIDTSSIASSGPPLSNGDCPPKFEAIRVIQLGLETLRNAALGGTDLFFPEQVPFAVELGKLYRNDPCYFLSAANCPVSPLVMSKLVSDLAVAKAPYGKVYAVPTMPIAGANAPLTPQGTAVVGVAEILAGYVLAKALNPKTPVAATALTAKMDLKTGAIVYIAPEVFVADVAIAEVMKHHVGLPCSTFGIYIDAKLPGMQAVYERMMRSAALAVYGDLSAFEGTLDHGRVFSATQLQLDCDTHSLFARYTEDPDLTEDTLAIEEIVTLGWEAKGGYMMSDHTMRHMRDAWRSSIYRPEPVDEQRYLAAARQQWQGNLSRYQPPDLPDDFLRELRRICDRARQALS